MTDTDVSIENFTITDDTILPVDVRSPSEFSAGHIPGAVNLPLFNDTERAEIGTLYKQKGRYDAVLHGLGTAGPKMRNIVEDFVNIQTRQADHTILLHCFKGGMRSHSVKWLLDLAGIDVPVLAGGYKAYRRYVRTIFSKKYTLVILSGQTGCGKTAVLKELRQKGEQVIDLESLANHRGSVFGGVGRGPQPTTQQFENNLAAELEKMNPEKRIWLENESPLIGTVYLPKPLIDQMRTAPILRISLPVAEREKRILREYGTFNPDEMEPLIKRLKKFLGNQACNEAIEGLYNNDLHRTVSILMAYYDKTYRHYRKKYNRQPAGILDFDKDEPDKIAVGLIQLAEERNL